VIVRGDVRALLDAAKRHGVKVHRALDNFIVVSASAAQIAALRVEPGVVALNSDQIIGVAASVSDRTMATDQTREGSSGLLGIGGWSSLSGRGVGVAVVDSGITEHDALKGKVVAEISFVPDDPSTDDEYGHGTHIAGIIAGASSPARYVTSAYRGGIARSAHLINVRALGDDGMGLTSSVIAGLDWVIANRSRYAIRVVNLSLGQTITAPCALDPLCSSIQRVVASGIIAVVSAGNRGKAPTGQAVLGGITSPGNSPFAITVGALNTYGTTVRTDDTVAWADGLRLLRKARHRRAGQQDCFA
jgi:serine protease AprX